MRRQVFHQKRTKSIYLLRMDKFADCSSIVDSRQGRSNNEDDERIYIQVEGKYLKSCSSLIVYRSPMKSRKYFHHQQLHYLKRYKHYLMNIDCIEIFHYIV